MTEIKIVINETAQGKLHVYPTCTMPVSSLEKTMSKRLMGAIIGTLTSAGNKATTSEMKGGPKSAADSCFAAEWFKWRDCIYPEGLPREQGEEISAAFYSGALAFFSKTVGLDNNEEGVRRLDAWRVEMETFLRQHIEQGMLRAQRRN